MAEVITQQQLQLLPDYQEKYLKDLLANVYNVQTDPSTGETTSIGGIAAFNPLLGQPQFDADGNPVYQRDSSGNLVLDARGQPMQEVLGGVPAPDVMPLTPGQMAGIQMGYQGIGAYAPLLEAGKQTYEMGVGSAISGYDESGRPRAFDPRSYQAYYDPFVEQVIDTTQADIARQGALERQRLGAQAVQAGAFGGSRQAVAEQELQRNMMDQMAQTGAQLRSQAYTGAQQQAQSAFENQMARGQSGAQVFQGLGTAQAGIGQLAQTLGQQDVKSALDLGTLEQQQRQAEYDVQREGAIEMAYEPFQRFSYMSDIFRGVPSSGSTLTTGTAPQSNTLGSVVGTAMGLGAYGNTYGGGSILGGLQ